MRLLGNGSWRGWWEKFSGNPRVCRIRWMHVIGRRAIEIPRPRCKARHPPRLAAHSSRVSSSVTPPGLRASVTPLFQAASCDLPRSYNANRIPLMFSAVPHCGTAEGHWRTPPLACTCPSERGHCSLPFRLLHYILHLVPGRESRHWLQVHMRDSLKES